MTDVLTVLLKITVVIFMAGNLLDLGLRLDLKAALEGMRDVRFVTMSLVWSFILGPALAWGLTRVIPLTEPHAMGLILLGLTPCAPLLPMVAEKARGDLNYAATFMLLASVGTVLLMPLAVPLMIEGLTVSAGSIVKPLLLLVVIPLAIGVGIQILRPSTAAQIQLLIKKGTGIDTVVMLLLVVIIYGKGFVGSIGSYAIGTQAVFYLVITAGSYGLGFGMPPHQKAVMSLGLCTRNCGTALAPLFIAADVDRSAIVMVTLGIPMMFISALIAARVFATRSPQGREAERSGRQSASAAKNIG